MDSASAKFALAGNKSDDQYQELQFAKNVPVRFGEYMLIVLRDVAEAARKQDQSTQGTTTTQSTSSSGARGQSGSSVRDARPQRFSGVIELDTIRGAL
jgi:hypothetical protein